MNETSVESRLGPTLLTVLQRCDGDRGHLVLRDPIIEATVVTDEAGSAVGIITESDIVAVVAETDSRPSVNAFMSRPVVIVSPSTSLETAAETMREKGIKHLPVVDNETYRGLISASTLETHLPSHRLGRTNR